MLLLLWLNEHACADRNLIFEFYKDLTRAGIYLKLTIYVADNTSEN